MKILTRIKSFYNAITSSIAFYPILIAIAAIFLASAVKIAEGAGISNFLNEHATILTLHDADTARNLLTTFIAGGISILVFSFSMVMLLLNQAATNYSPRILPNLISERKHQIVLGIFFGTILFSIMIILDVDPTGNDYLLPSFSIIIAIAIALTALTAFIYFIHSISSSIQINNIMREIFTLSRKRLQILIDDQNSLPEFENMESWHVYRTPRGGTFQNLSTTALSSHMSATDNKMHVVPLKGRYLREEDVLFRTQNKLTDEECDQLYKNFNFSNTELVSDNYILGIKQLSEIGIKAMSPGVNDPGTAINSIDYITELFALRMLKNDHHVICDEEKKPILSLNDLSFEDMIYHTLAPFRNYCKHDFTVMYKIFEMLAYLINLKSVKKEFYSIIKKQADLCLQDIEKAIENKHDLEKLQLLYRKINHHEK